MPKLVPTDDRELQKRKWQLAADLAEARLLHAGIDFELAKTHPDGSKQAKASYAKAAENYAELYKLYRTRAVGLLARLWEGRCRQELGEYQQALGCFRQLLDLPDAAETRSIRTKATRHALECWTAKEVKQYRAAFERGELWQKDFGAEAANTDAQAIRYLTAVAYQEEAESLPAGDPNRKRLTSSAREHVSPVARQPGAFQRPAKTLLVALSGSGAGVKTADAKAAEPKTFAEALHPGAAGAGSHAGRLGFSHGGQEQRRSGGSRPIAGTERRQCRTGHRAAATGHAAEQRGNARCGTQHRAPLPVLRLLGIGALLRGCRAGRVPRTAFSRFPGWAARRQDRAGGLGPPLRRERGRGSLV